MHLVQILLPLYDNDGKTIGKKNFKLVKSELTRRFDGLTAYSRNTAEGIWTEGKETRKDEIVIYEVMVMKPDPKWWRAYRKELERRFKQQSVIIRANKIKLL